MEAPKTLKEISALCPVNKDRDSTEYNYKGFQDFLSYSPQRLWPGFIIDSYNWTENDELLIFYKKVCGNDSKVLVERQDKRHIKFPVRAEEDTTIRTWIRENMNILWKLL